MIDVGIIMGTGLYELPGDREARVVRNRFGETEVAISRVGPWIVGSICRHGKYHRHLPHTVPHRAHLLAFEQLGARAILATTVVGAVDPGLPLGRPMLFDDLLFPDNRLPDGEPCTIFDAPGDSHRGHLVSSESFSPRLRKKVELAADYLGIDMQKGGTYAHTNGPRFETKAEIKALAAAGATAVSQTCGPETVLAGELGIRYALVGFPVNRATGVGEPESKEALDSMLALSTRVLPKLVVRTVEMLEEEDLSFDYGYVYRIEGGAGRTDGDLALS